MQKCLQENPKDSHKHLCPYCSVYMAKLRKWLRIVSLIISVCQIDVTIKIRESASLGSFTIRRKYLILEYRWWRYFYSWFFIFMPTFLFLNSIGARLCLFFAIFLFFFVALSWKLISPFYHIYDTLISFYSIIFQNSNKDVELK